EGIEFFANKHNTYGYIAYFQAYSSTYGDTANTMRLYREALSHPSISGLIIGTRPDCIADDLLRELVDIAKHTYVCIEIGAESIYNETLAAVNRCHTWEQTQDAVRRVAAVGIDVGIHLIMGLPGETREMMLAEADAVSELPVTIVKLHQLQIVRGSSYERIYAENPSYFDLFKVDEYADFCVRFVRRLRPDIVVDRFTNQSPHKMVIAPCWGLKNNEFTRLVESKLDKYNQSPNETQEN
ncbi:MAG: TIGR01212 family radical SAM protein, partial [Bacteroidales bacterium]|nr:TIGR01212 family radical SAM protein [Bacteroidales bacterium]